MTVKKLKIVIEKNKKQLLAKAKSKGLYENFGENEVRKLKDKFINSSSYTDEMNAMRNLINNFSDWASSVNENDLK